MSFSLPPLSRRIVTYASAKTKKISLIEQVCILPIGGGLWFPVRNLTKSLESLEKGFAVASKHLENLTDGIKAETEYINKEIERIGFFAESTLVKDPVTGEYHIVDLRTLIDFRLKGKKVVANPRPKSRKEVFGNLLVETRKPSSGGQQQKKKNSNGN